MKTITFYECEICNTQYFDPKLALQCEASKPLCEFKVGQKVFLKEPGSGFSKGAGRSVEIREIRLEGTRYPNSWRDPKCTEPCGHHWNIRLGLADDRGASVWTSPAWLESAE